MKWFFLVCVMVDHGNVCRFGYAPDRPHDTEAECEETRANFLADNPHIPPQAAACHLLATEPGASA